MRSGIVTAFVMLMSLGFAPPFQAADGGLTPEMPVYDFGAVLEGTTIAHDFVIRNDSPRHLAIEDFRIGCSCTEIVGYDRDIGPGETGTIRVSFATKGYGGQTIEKSFGVVTSDPRAPLFQLTFKGTVDLFADIRPRLVKLHGHEGDALEETVVITPKAAYPFTVKDIQLKNGRDVACRLLEEADGYKVEIRASREKPGRFFDTVIIATDHALQPEIRIRVFGYLKEAADRS